MITYKRARRALLLTSVCSAALLSSPASATDTVVGFGVTSSTPIIVTGTDTVTVNNGGTATNNAGGFGPIIWGGNATGAGITVTNNGTMSNTKTGVAPPIVVGGDTYQPNGFSTFTAGNAWTGKFNVINNGVMSSTQGPVFLFAPAAGDINFTNNSVIMAGGGYQKNGAGQGQLNQVAIAFGSGTNVFTNTAGGNVAGDIILGSGTNTVNIQAGSTIAGGIYGQASGTNTINLSGPGTGYAYGQSTGGFQGWNNINTLNVLSGNWVLNGGGYYENLNIASGAVFNICDLTSISVGQCSNRFNGTPTDGGIGPLIGNTLNVTLNGLMITQSNDGRIYYDPAAIAEFKVTGTGNFLIQNTAGTGGYVGPKSNLAGFAGTTTVDGGKFILGTTIGGNVVINPKGTLQIGSGGSLRNINGDIVDDGKVGNVLGNIVDNGTLIFNRLDNFTYAGNLSGNGNIIKAQSNTVTLSGQYTYTGKTTILAGAVVLAPTAKLSTVSALDVSSGSLSLNGTSQSVAGLSSTDGSGGTINMGGGSLTVTQSDNSSFGGTLTGGGAVNKAGSGSLILNGSNSSYTGTTSVSGGLVEVGDASNPGATLGGTVNVTAGGALGGHGTITGSVSNSGTTKPGGSIGTLTVGGNYAFGAGAVLETETNANGATDLIQAGGVISIDPSATVIAQPEDAVANYGSVTKYTILRGAGGVSGTFNGVTSSVAGLAPVLDYTSNSVILTLVKSGQSLSSYAATTNQLSVATALSGGPGSEIYGRIFLNGAAAGPQALTAVSGEMHATLRNVLLNDGGAFAGIIAGHTAENEGIHIWGSQDARFTRLGGGGVASSGRNNGWAFAAGADMPVSETVRVGAAIGYSNDDLTVAAANSYGRINSGNAGVYAQVNDGPLSGDVTLSYGWHNIGTLRRVAFTGFGQTVNADYDAHSYNMTGEVRYALEDGLLFDGISTQPFFAISGTRLESDAFSETGGSAALKGASSNHGVIFTRLGSRFTGSYAMGSGTLLPRLSLAWEHGFNSITARERLSFVSGGPQFLATGAPLSRDDLALGVGTVLQMGRFGIDLSYNGRLGGNTTQHGVNLRLQLDL